MKTTKTPVPQVEQGQEIEVFDFHNGETFKAKAITGVWDFQGFPGVSYVTADKTAWNALWDEDKGRWEMEEI